MINIKHLAYKKFNLTRVSMLQDTQFQIPVSENDISIGVICVKGGTQHVENITNGPHLPQEGDKLLLNDDINGWSNDKVGHRSLNLYAPVDTEWVCITENGSGRPALTYVELKNTFIIPAKTGVIVITGTCSIDNKIGLPDNYFAPRENENIATGNGEIILLS